MMRLILLFPIVFGYTILNNWNKEMILPKPYTFCEGLDMRIQTTFYELQETMKQSGYPITESDNGTVICDYYGKKYGHYAFYDMIDDRIEMSRDLYETTLYNTFFHEIIHSFGLNHSTDPGIMNYSIKNDNTHLWLSIDDLSGLYFLK